MSNLPLEALEPRYVKLTAPSSEPNVTWAFIQFCILMTQAVCEQKQKCVCSLSLDHNRDSVQFPMRKMSRPEQEAPEAWTPTTCPGPWELHCRSFLRPLRLQCHLRLYSLLPGNHVSSYCPVAAFHGEIQAASYSQMASLRHPAFSRGRAV